MSETIDCPGCERTLEIGAVEIFLFKGMPLECEYCDETLGTIGVEMRFEHV